MGKKGQRKFTAEEKATILRRHLVEKKQVSDICDEYKIRPGLFYEWQRAALGNLAIALESNKPRKTASKKEEELERRNKALEERLRKKEHVIAEVTEEMVNLKKELGEP